MNCSECGRATSNDSALFCIYCGTPFYPVFVDGGVLYKKGNGRLLAIIVNPKEKQVSSIRYIMENGHSVDIPLRESSEKTFFQILPTEIQASPSGHLQTEITIREDGTRYYTIAQKLDVAEMPKFELIAHLSPLETPQIVGVDIGDIHSITTTPPHLSLKAGVLRGKYIAVSLKMLNDSCLRIRGQCDDTYTFEGLIFKNKQFSLSPIPVDNDVTSLQHVIRLDSPFFMEPLAVNITTEIFQQVPEMRIECFQYGEVCIMENHVDGEILDLHSPKGCSRLCELQIRLIGGKECDAPLVRLLFDNAVIFENSYQDTKEVIEVPPLVISHDSHQLSVQMLNHQRQVIKEKGVRIKLNHKELRSIDGMSIDFGTENTTVAVWNRHQQPDPFPELINIEQKGARDHAVIPSVIAREKTENDDLLKFVGLHVKHTKHESKWHKLKLHREDSESDLVRQEASLFLYEVLRRSLYNLWRGHRGGIQRIDALYMSCPTAYFALKQYTDNLKKIIINAVNIFNHRVKNENEGKLKIEEANIIFVDEALAHVLHYQETGRYMIYDFGGGTTDIVVVDKNEDNMKVIAYCGARLGGAHVSSMFFSEIANVCLGQNRRFGYWIDRGERNLPSESQWANNDITLDDLFPFAEALKETVGLGGKEFPHVFGSDADPYELMHIREALAYPLSETIFSKIIPRLRQENVKTFTSKISEDLKKQVIALLSAIQKQMEDHNFTQSLKIVLVGGSSRLLGFKAMIKKCSNDLGFKVKIIQPEEVKKSLVQGMLRAPETGKVKYVNQWEVFLNGNKRGLGSHSMSSVLRIDVGHAWYPARSFFGTYPIGNKKVNISFDDATGKLDIDVQFVDLMLNDGR